MKSLFPMEIELLGQHVHDAWNLLLLMHSWARWGVRLKIICNHPTKQNLKLC